MHRPYRKTRKTDENLGVLNGFRETAPSIFSGRHRGSRLRRGRLCPLPHRATPSLRPHLSPRNRDQDHSVLQAWAVCRKTSRNRLRIGSGQIGDDSSRGYRCLKKKMKATRPSPRPWAIIPGIRLFRHNATIVNTTPMSRTGTNRIQPW
jgi:hypothetical protein